MHEFLFILALIWIAFASVSDLRRREIANWISFSLIAFALAYRAFYSVFNNDLGFFIWGLLGLAVFTLIGYGFYYARIFAGGDTKLMIALGPILPIYAGLWQNIAVSLGFVLLLMFAGSIWGILYSLFLVFKSRKEFATEFKKQSKKYFSFFIVSFIFALLAIVFPVYTGDIVMILVPVLFLLLPILYVYAKSIEESCMIVSLRTKELTEGDWLYEKVKVGKKTINPYWEGLSLEQVNLLKRYNKNVRVKQGIPFVPAFFFAFILIWAVIQYGLLGIFGL